MIDHYPIEALAEFVAGGFDEVRASRCRDHLVKCETFLAEVAELTHLLYLDANPEEGIVEHVRRHARPRRLPGKTHSAVRWGWRLLRTGP
jgi:hypothetical protein